MSFCLYCVIFLTRSGAAAANAGDLVTFITENYLAFVDGSKPMSEWDAYVSEAMTNGGDAIAAIYQDALDKYYA